jgi:histidinol-phosphate aminotransferase
MPGGKLLLAAHESPFNVPAKLQAEIQKSISEFDFNRYPDPLSKKLRRQIAFRNGLEPECVLVGNGGDELLLDLLLAWGGNDSAQDGRKRSIMQFSPTFSMYKVYAELLETRILDLPRDPNDFSIDVDLAISCLQNNQVDLCILDNPGNPTGSFMDEADICRIVEASDSLIVVDEAYFEFSGQSMLPYLKNCPNLVILRTFSKAYSLAGLRLGYVLANPEVVDMLARVRMPYSVNAFTQGVGELVMDNVAKFDQSIAEITAQRTWLFEQLQTFAGLKVWPSQANFLLFRVDNAELVWQKLRDDHDIYIRYFANSPGLENCLRVTVGSRHDNIRFITALREVMARLSLPSDALFA